MHRIKARWRATTAVLGHGSEPALSPQLRGQRARVLEQLLRHAELAGLGAACSRVTASSDPSRDSSARSPPASAIAASREMLVIASCSRSDAAS